MKLSQLRAAIAVADCSNFSEAALVLNLSQSAISHAIAALEDELGVPLFARGRFGAVLTPAGETIISHARQAMQQIESMQIEANRHKGLHGGQIRIASFRSVATNLLPTVLVQFHAQFPDIGVTIMEMECFDNLAIEQKLREGRADLGFVVLPVSTGFETWEILRDEYVLLLPPNLKIKSDKLTWKDLEKLPLILTPEDLYTCDIPLHQHLKKHTSALNIVYEINQDSTTVGMVSQGLGATIMPRLAAEPIPLGLKVLSLPIPFERVIGVAILRDALHVPAVFAFLDRLKSPLAPNSGGTRK
jgi:DNA-binding transcriptional LysR family regulator